VNPESRSIDTGRGRRARGANAARHPFDDRALHDHLITLRHKTYAHTDTQSGRSAGTSSLTTSAGIAHTTYSEGWWAFPREWIPAVADLCSRQAQRFREEAAKIDAQLAETDAA